MGNLNNIKINQSNIKDDVLDQSLSKTRNKQPMEVAPAILEHSPSKLREINPARRLPIHSYE